MDGVLFVTHWNNLAQSSLSKATIKATEKNRVQTFRSEFNKLTIGPTKKYRSLHFNVLNF